MVAARNTMVQVKLTTAQRAATRELIRAKSDREIARLLRQSHRLLNLNRRRRSCISHRERWTDYEIRLLGRIRVEELAKLLRRGVSAVAGERESRGIPIFAPQRGWNSIPTSQDCPSAFPRRSRAASPRTTSFMDGSTAAQGAGRNIR